MKASKNTPPKEKPFKFEVSHAVQTSRNLLNMMYTSDELAEVFKTRRRVIIEGWIKAGLPHTKDEHGHYWFNGYEVAAWMKDVHEQAKAAKPKYPPDVTWCVRCWEMVKMKNIQPEEDGKYIFNRGLCPHCGTQLRRMITTKGAAW